MRTALSSLTLRGRAFLAAGTTAVVCAVLLGQEPLVRIGALVVALPLLAAVLVGRGRQRLSLVRSVTPSVVTTGQPAEVRLDLANDGNRHTGLLLLEEHLPYVLGTRPRFVLDGLAKGAHRHVSYQVRSDVRGHFPIGPMTVRVTDPFGMVELGRTFHVSHPLVVTPRTVSLPSIPLGGSWSGSGDNRPRAFAIGSAEDVTVREYRTGDDLRRVHWRSSARAGELMVRREEQPWHSRATLFLDNRSGAHRGQGSASSLETAVSAMASIGLHLGERGYAVRLVTATGEDPGTTWHERDAGASRALLLETLAAVELVDRPHLDNSWLTEQTHTGLLVAVLGDLDPADQSVLRRMQHHAGSCLAVVLDVESWARGASPTPGRTSSTLAGLGWRSATLLPQGSLPAAWQQLGQSRSPATTGGAGS
ncbi:DUF58 domain-containing protein [Nocardioides sp.]|uniref:DUF58 domain-containing protein n=1 Tax=Nocardioides sp. TaxID=35761 RepID=UPI0027348EE3|nr:DUF58 domain-containing protein [Nocardioides sp.]MDP3889709.1 DUF58 domain-containing protein [Nocardioides sp.]